MPVYLDCNATTPLDPGVRALVLQYLDVDFGNAGSRTHTHGDTAKRAVETARAQVAAAAGASADEVTFTSGATESNNLAILGLAAHGLATRRTHVVTTQIEHMAVLEPMAELQRRGFEVEVLPVDPGGYVRPEVVEAALRPNTLLVSVMTANNETGILQPLEDIAKLLDRHDAYFHTDAAQAFGRTAALKHRRIDLISASAHKLYAPKGVGTSSPGVVTTLVLHSRR